MHLLLRCLPYFAGLYAALAFWIQRDFAGVYPWIALTAIAVVPCASIIIAWRKVKLGDLMEKMTPAYLLLVSFAFGLLLAETSIERWLIVMLAGVSSIVSLELLFLLARYPSSYPVNGLSHVNIAYVPFIIWYAAATSSGIMVFLHSNAVWHVIMMTVLGVVLYRTTGHPGATRGQNAVWVMVGALVGLEIGLIGLILPVSMKMQGFLAALIFCAALRVRRYLYDPKPSRRLAVSEAAAACALFIASLLTAKWL